MGEIVKLRTILHPGMPEEMRDIIDNSIEIRGRGVCRAYFLPRSDAERAQRLAAQWTGAVDTEAAVEAAEAVTV